MNDINKFWADKLLDLRNFVEHEAFSYDSYIMEKNVLDKIDEMLKEISK